MNRPTFKPDEHGMSIEAVVNLPSWARMGELVDFPRFRHLPQNGSLMICIGDFDRGTAPPTPEEQACVDEFLANAERLRLAILEDLLRRYDGIREEYRDECGYDEDDEDFKQTMPDASTLSDIERLVRPIRVRIFTQRRDGVPFVGIEMQVQWEQEHGLGMILLGDRIVAQGGGDVADAEWRVDKEMGTTPDN